MSATPTGGADHQVASPGMASTSGGPTPSAGWTGTSVRLVFGVIWAINALLKWLPGYRHSYISNLKQTAQGQPSWLHWWFHFWIKLQSGAPGLFATLTGLVFSPPARRERLSLDQVRARRWGWWRRVAEPHAIDRVPGSVLVEPVIVSRS